VRYVLDANIAIAARGTWADAYSSLRLSLEELRHLGTKRGQVGFEDAPDHVAQNACISVNEAVAERDDATGVADQASKV
jgi:hypothetical protein